MALNVGINVTEVDGRASPAIQAAPTSVAAFVGIAERGAPNRPLRISSPQQFEERFGRHLAGSHLAYAVNGFFLNGGTEAYIVRVVGGGATPALRTLANRVTPTSTDALRVAAGYRGVEDPGAWGLRLRVDVRDDPRGSTTLQTPTVGSASSAQLQSLAGFQVGTVIRFVDGVNAPHYRKITEINVATSTVNWATTAPITPILPTATTVVTSAEFRLVVEYQTDPTAEFAVVEDWRYLSMETDSAYYVADRINHPLTGSRYVTVADLSGPAASGLENPAVVSDRQLQNGTDAPPIAASYVGLAANRTGYFALDTVQVQLLAAPDIHQLTLLGPVTAVRGALDYCAGRGDCTFVGSTPDRAASGTTTPRAPSEYDELENDYINRIRTYAGNFQASKVYGALYAGWIQVADPIAGGPAPTRFVPADGHVMGVYARTDLERGIWKAPAGNGALVRGALAVSAAFTDGQHTDLVRNVLVNGIRFQRGTGIIVAASRTLSSDTRWWFVSTRLLFNFVKSSLRDGLRFVRQEPHSDELRRSLRINVVRPFLLNLWRQGAFGSDPPDQVFTIKCDAENNPPDQVVLGNLTIEVYFYAVRPAETILIVVGQQPSGASASEA